MSVPFAVRVQQLLPQRLLCAFIYRVSRSRIGWFKSALIAWFAKQYRIDLEEAADPRLDSYATFNDFFTRPLRSGARPIDTGDDTIVSPADGTLTRADDISAGRIIQAKGFEYSLAELLGEPGHTLEDFDGGTSATIYLAPHNYHRVHVPTAARLTAMQYIAGKRYSVNATTAAFIESLYCRNERLVCWFEAPFGRFAAVLVGALNVSSIATTVTGEIRSGTDRSFSDIDGATFGRGDEFARFNLGSTVVLAFPRDSVAFECAPQNAVLMGQRIARLVSDSRAL